ncbi:hypothetical protein [Flexibacterium corallicola]|uniref:hypothetical protein n=1 Tax=Flexibacterium corallicola TaxID=3037259 RepID=UPI00286F969C|nr:hypothetical protein [Pseudovibrio sp. M1P-2-3]
MPTKQPDPFFIGWSKKPPKALRWFLFVVSAVLVGAAAGVAFGLGASLSDPGDGHFSWSQNQQPLMGVIEAKPYPILRVVKEGQQGSSEAILLAGIGKRGIQSKLTADISGPVKIQGVPLKRGTINMLQVGRIEALEETAAASQQSPIISPSKSLGRWRLTGEICDGKCYIGAMRPGNGLAHKACANLCIIGGLPPVFVTSSPIKGQSFFLLSDEQGNPLSSDFLDYTALLISMEGEVEQRDDLLIFKIDPTSVERL